MCSVLGSCNSGKLGLPSQCIYSNDIAPLSLPAQCHSFLLSDLLACEQSMFWLARDTVKTIKLASLLPVPHGGKARL
jgi:hypothetical protein